MIKFYKVGGCVRDKFLNRKSKDIDYSVEAPSYEDMKAEIINRGGTIYLENPEYLTLRANVPNMGACDYVLCRKDGEYIDGRRPESVEHGTIYDDLARRDFTMNAIAEDEDGNFIDPFNGIRAINERMIETVGWVGDRFREDGLRILRALRFSITLGFNFHGDIYRFLLSDNVDMDSYLGGVSVERIREELYKMFMHCTLDSLVMLEKYPNVRYAIFDSDVFNDLRLMPTLKAK